MQKKQHKTQEKKTQYGIKSGETDDKSLPHLKIMTLKRGKQLQGKNRFETEKIIRTTVENLTGIRTGAKLFGT